MNIDNLKFRVWDKKLKLLGDVSNIDFDIKSLIYFSDKNAEFYANFEDVELIQSTLLFDKNGVEIFEGDIVVGKFYFAGVGYFDTGEREVIVRNKPVLWEDGKFLCSGFDLSEMNECIKVIGNIYKNKELLR